MRIFDGIDELEQNLGSHLGYSGWHQVTQDQIDRFADATGDHQWIHVDPVRAAEGPFGCTIAHGFLTLALIPLLTPQIYRVEGLHMALNYGCNRVRFPDPVPVGSRIRCGAELTTLNRNSAGGQAVVRVTVERDGADKPVCVADTVTVLVQN